MSEVNGDRTGRPIRLEAYQAIKLLSAQIAPKWHLASVDLVDGVVQVTLDIPCCSNRHCDKGQTVMIGMPEAIVRDDLPWTDAFAENLNTARIMHARETAAADKPAN